MFTLYVGYQGTVDVGSSIQVTYGGLVYNRITQQFASTLTLKNIGSNPVPGPIQVVLHGLPAGVTVANAAGTNNGDPYVATDPTVIAPGATVTVLVQFQRTGSQNISYTTRVLSGAF